MFDIIFAGGGTTACVIAGRLATADPTLEILVVESGQHSRDVPHHVQPSRFVEHLTRTSTTVSFHVAKPSPHLNGRSATVPCGRSVGGGSAVNIMLYARGAASDYNDWYEMGNNGWSFDELLPLIKKLETFTPISNSPTHGYTGPVRVSAGGADLGIGKQFLDVAKAYDPTRPQVDDNNDFSTANAYSVAYKYIDPAAGKRSDAASRYLYPHSGNPNLTIMVAKCVQRVITENGRAIGIEYATDAKSPEGTGAFGSPSILERSGIGARLVLEGLNIPVLVDLPGVGENYQDHLGVSSVFYASAETQTMDEVWNDPNAFAAQFSEWATHGTGKIAHNGIEAMAKVRPTEMQLTSAGPVVQSKWTSFFQHRPDKPLGIIVPFSGFPFPHRSAPPANGRKYFSALYYIVYPGSKGSVHITSSHNANSPLDFDPGYLSDPGDVAQLTMLYKMTRELARRMHAYRGEVPAYHPKFPAGSLAGCTETDVSVPMDVPDIIYSAADDEAIAKSTRDRVTTIEHSLGTCAMKPREQGGVVDPRLDVYGEQGLKVADMSICPTNVGNNTYSTALLIGEKAATIIGEELGIVLEPVVDEP